MKFKFDNSGPIYLQLIEELKIRIVTNYYESGSRLPSVREFASDMQVNPNTVQRALVELENIGLITTERTNGKFVTSDKNVIKKIKKELVGETIDNFLESIKRFDISKKEIISYLENK